MGKRFSFVVISLEGLLILLFSTSLRAQNWQLLDSITYPLPFSICSDANEKIYTTSGDGIILKLSQHGDTLQTYQPINQESPILSPWQILRLQAYFPFQQKLLLLDQNLNTVSSITLPETTLGNATFSSDQQVWYVSSDLALRKYHPSWEENTLSVSLPWLISLDSQIKMLREYQNRLYIQTDEELLIFDLFGNFLNKLPLPTSDTVQFSGNELYFVSDQDVHFINLYSLVKRRWPIPAGKNISKVLVEKEYIHGFSERFWFVYVNTN